MNPDLIDRIVHAVLYEGYILYPYRRGTKNTQRWTFGNVFPNSYTSEPSAIQLQCLFRANEDASLNIKLQFLQLIDRNIALAPSPSTRLFPSPGTPGESEGGGFSTALLSTALLSRAARGEGLKKYVDEIEIDGKLHQSWQEATERAITAEINVYTNTKKIPFSFPAQKSEEPLSDRTGKILATLERTQSSIEGEIEIRIEPKRDNLFQLTVRATNITPLENPNSLPRDQAQKHSMASSHLIVTATSAQFLSSIDPPPESSNLAHECKNVGVYPVLVGNPGETDAILASPIILYDYPQIAPESPGDLFDGTEIDEILSLRILTLGDDEKRAAADLDPRSADLLRRTESLARDQLARLHGAMRPPRKVQAVHIADAELRPGDRIILRPRGSADAFDILLSGKSATIAAIEQDFENRIHLAVTIDDDPGADIGAAGKIGHRFYFKPEEVEPYREHKEVFAP